MNNELKRAIKYFKDTLEGNQIILHRCGEEGTNPLVYARRDKYLKMAIAALERVAEPKPLTPEEVQSMVGEWIWIERLDTRTKFSGYAFVATHMVVGFLELTYWMKDYGKKWIAYDREVKGDGNGGET